MSKFLKLLFMVVVSTCGARVWHLIEQCSEACRTEILGPRWREARPTAYISSQVADCEMGCERYHRNTPIFWGETKAHLTGGEEARHLPITKETGRWDPGVPNDTKHASAPRNGPSWRDKRQYSRRRHTTASAARKRPTDAIAHPPKHQHPDPGRDQRLFGVTPHVSSGPSHEFYEVLVFYGLDSVS